MEKLKYFNIFVAVSLYWFVSICMVFVNKNLLSSSKLKLNAPLFITWFQCVVTVILCLFFSVLSIFVKFIQFPSLTFEYKKALEILPLSIIMLLMITFNNLCLKYVNVSFYFIGRSLTTVFNVVFTYFLLNTTTSMKSLLCCCIIIFGFYFGIDQENKLGFISWFGVICGIGASIFVALNAIYTRKKIEITDNNVWKLCFYNNINASILFIPLIIIFGEIPELKSFQHFNELNFWTMMFIGGFFGFAIGYVTGLQIQVTSPLTHNVSGTAKACAQTILACVLFHEVKNWLWWSSNMIVMGGSFAYAMVRNHEMNSVQLMIPK